MGIHSGVCGLRSQPMPAVASKFSIVGAGNVSMGSIADLPGGR